MSWNANWYRSANVIVGSESVTVSRDNAASVLVSSKDSSVSISNKKAKSVIISNNQQSVTVRDKSVSVEI